MVSAYIRQSIRLQCIKAVLRLNFGLVVNINEHVHLVADISDYTYMPPYAE
jgi:hypothetical protein